MSTALIIPFLAYMALGVAKKGGVLQGFHKGGVILKGVPKGGGGNYAREIINGYWGTLDKLKDWIMLSRLLFDTILSLVDVDSGLVTPWWLM